MPFIPVADTAKSVDSVNEKAATFQGRYGESAEELTGVAATAIEVNELIVGSQWTSLGFAIILTRSRWPWCSETFGIRFGPPLRLLLRLPCNGSSCGEWMFRCPWRRSIGSILVGVGVDFSIHIANRIRELGGGIQAIRTAAVGTGMSLFEAAVVTSLGMYTAYDIPIPEITPFITVILILLWVAAASADLAPSHLHHA